MKLLKYSIVLILSFSNLAYNQFIDDFKGLKCQGLIPQTILNSFEERVNIDMNKHLSDNLNRKQKKAEEKFIIESNFRYRQLLLSGRVTFGDTLSNYLNRIKDRLLTGEEEKYRDEINIFVLKSHQVNAFATNDGNIYFCTGLLARLKNEAQLAFVVGHEIQHYISNHLIEGVLNNVEIISNNKITNYEYMLRTSKHSKKNEIEADTEGLKRTLKAGYFDESIMGVFDILEEAHLPYTDYEVNPTDFNELEIDFSKYFSMKKIDAKVEKDTSDLFASHPNLNTRRKNLNDRFEIKNSSQTIISNVAFNELITAAKIETAINQLKQGFFSRSIFNLILLNRQYPDNEFISKNLLAAYYAVIKNKMYREKWYKRNHVHLKGNLKNVAFLIQKCEIEELAFSFLSKAYRHYKKYNSSHVKNMFKDIQIELESRKNYSKDFFLSGVTKSNKRKNKYKSNSSSNIKRTSNPFKLIQKEKEFIELISADNTDLVSSNQTKFLIINPKFLQFNSVEKTFGDASVGYLAWMEYKKVDELNNNFLKMFESLENHKNLPDFDILSINALSANETEKFNDFILLQNSMTNISINKEFKTYIPINFDDIEEFKKIHNYSHIVNWYTLNNKRKTTASLIVYIGWVFYLPVKVPYDIARKYPNHINYKVAELNNYSLIKEYNQKLKGKPTNDTFKSHLYYSLQQLNKIK